MSQNITTAARLKNIRKIQSLNAMKNIVHQKRKLQDNHKQIIHYRENDDAAENFSQQNLKRKIEIKNDKIITYNDYNV